MIATTCVYCRNPVRGTWLYFENRLQYFCRRCGGSFYVNKRTDKVVRRKVPSPMELLKRLTDKELLKGNGDA